MIYSLPIYFTSFGRFSQNCQKRLLALSCLSVPHGTPLLPLDGLSLNLTFELFSKICPENSSFIKIGKEKSVLHTKTKMPFDHISLISS